MNEIDRQTMLKHAARRYGQVQVPGIGTAYFQNMTEREYQADRAGAWQQASGDDQEQLQREFLIQFRARAIRRCQTNANHDRIWGDSDQDLADILNIDAAIITVIYGAIKSHCELDDTIPEKKRDSSEIAGDSTPTASPAGAAGSTSTACSNSSPLESLTN